MLNRAKTRAFQGEPVGGRNCTIILACTGGLCIDRRGCGAFAVVVRLGPSRRGGTSRAMAGEIALDARIHRPVADTSESVSRMATERGSLMNRKQRRTHAILWLALSALMAVTIVGSAAVKARIDHALKQGPR